MTGTGPIALPAASAEPLGPVHRPARPRAVAATRATRVGLRLLIIGAEGTRSSYRAARAAAERIGVPHRAVALADTPFDSVRLYDPDGTCRFAGIILATSGLATEDPDSGEHVSALSDDDWTRLATYEQRCGAREAVWYAYPSRDLGLAPASSFDGEREVRAGLTDSGAALFSDLVRDVSIPFEGVWGYLAAVNDPSSTTPLLETEAGDVLAAHHRRPDGTEVIAVTAGSGPYSLHSMLLQYGVVEWLLGGQFPGKRRVYLSPHIDDVFLASNLWTADGSQASYRMTASDVADLTAWQRDVQDRLPPGSTFVTSMGFNGVGAMPLEGSDPLVEALREQRAEYRWINHSWDHADMDDMSEADAFREIDDNCDLARDVSLEGFDRGAAITPHVSGLDNPRAIAGMAASGIRYLVSDTSVTGALRPENPGTNPSHNVGRHNPHDPRVYQVPRHPTNIFYNASVPEEQAGLYNELYRDWVGRELTYPEVIERDAAVGLSYLLSYDANPLMFHQANLRFWQSDDGRLHSLYTDWIDAVLDRYLASMKLPVLTLSMRRLSALMKQRAAYDACAVDAVRIEDEAGLRIELTAAASRCTVPLTGVAAPEAGRVEYYGDTPTTHVALGACESRVVRLSPE